MKRMTMALATLTLLLGSMGQVKADLITNGGFESHDASLDPVGGFKTLGSGSTAITGWTVGGDSIDYIGSYWVPSQGTYSLDMSGNAAGSISQTLTTNAGTTYRITFDLAGNPDGGPPVKSLSVSAGVASQIYTFDTTGHTDINMGWVSEVFNFTATGASTTLTFSSNINTAFGPALDNVSGSAVPEPATMTMLGFGVVSLVGYGWRRRKQAACVAG